MFVTLCCNFRKIAKHSKHQDNKYIAVVNPAVLNTPNLNKVYVKLSISSKAEEANTIAGIIDNRKALIFTLLGKIEQIIKMGRERSNNPPITNIDDINNTTNFSVTEVALRNEGFVMINNHSIKTKVSAV